jgi:hypothetical protein
MPAGVQRLQYGPVTDQSQVPVEPDGTQPESAEENSGLSQDERAELERLRAETAELQSKTAATGRRRRFSWRTPVSIVLIVLGCVLALVSVIGVWAGNEVSDTGRYVATVEPLIHDPAVQNALTDKITDQVIAQINVNGVINQAVTQLNSKGLPRLSTLLTTFSPQIASAVTSFVHSTVHTIIASPAMANAWVQVNTVAHQGIVKVLSGQGGGALSVVNGQIVLNLGPLIVVAKQDLVAHGFSLASNIPPVSPTFATLKIVLPILALLLLAGGVYAARGRRRALIGAGLGLAASMLVLAIGLLIARSIYLSSVPTSTLPSDAAAAAFDALVHFLKLGLRTLLLVGLVVAAGAFLTGPSRAAVATRSGTASGLEWIRHYGERRGVSTGPVGEWTYLHRRGLRIGAVSLFAVIFVFVGEPTPVLVIVLVILLLVVLGLIELIGRPAAAPETADQV